MRSATQPYCNTVSLTFHNFSLTILQCNPLEKRHLDLTTKQLAKEVTKEVKDNFSHLPERGSVLIGMAFFCLQGCN